MKRLIWILMLVLFSVVVFGSDELYYLNGGEVDVKIPCVYNNTLCSTGSVCNVTINFPNGSNFVDNQQMSNAGAYHNYTLSDSSVNGRYYSLVLCNDSGNYGYSTFYFWINNTGEEQDSNKFIFLMIMIVLLVMGYLYAGFNFDMKHWICKITLIFMGFFNMTGGIILGISGLNGGITLFFLETLLWGNLLLIFLMIAYYFIYILMKTRGMDKDD